MQTKQVACCVRTSSLMRSVHGQECDPVKISWNMRLCLLVDKYVTGPLLGGIVNIFQFLFVWLDKLSGNETPPVSDGEELQEYRNSATLSIDNVPDEFREFFHLALKWGIGDDAIRGEVVDSATETDKQELIAALTGQLCSIDRWIDSFPEGSMTDEAAAFMYLGEAIEEVRLDIELKRANDC